MGKTANKSVGWQNQIGIQIMCVPGAFGSIKTMMQNARKTLWQSNVITNSWNVKGQNQNAGVMMMCNVTTKSAGKSKSYTHLAGQAFASNMKIALT